MISIPSNQLEQFTADVFAATGCSRPEAERVARHLVAANLAGHDSHGVARIPRYVQMQRDGMLLANQQIDVLVPFRQRTGHQILPHYANLPKVSAIGP